MYIQYRSYKKFDEALFKHDIANAPYHVGNIFDDFDDIYWYNHMLIKYVMDDHAPLKRKRTVKKPVPFMNSKLRKACHRKAMHRNKYFRHGRTKDLWNKYRKTRNEVTKLKTVSMKNYFSERCDNENFVKNPTQYWKTIKPFLLIKWRNLETTLRCNKTVKS